jgi:O-methyltransferase involved in polyketide biosynthesis
VDGALTGVSETALLTLQVRALEARRPDAIIEDPMAIALLDSIEFDFAKFGKSRRQDVAIRALAFDAATRSYLLDHPGATVVALAEGLQTSFHRIESSGVGDQFHWLTVDFAPVTKLRARLLPASERVAVCSQSALDYSWMDRVGTGADVFITAEGLLMYLQPTEAMELITECARRFPGGRMMFDLPPAWLARVARRGMRASRRYRVPPMPFCLSTAQAAKLVDVVPGIAAVRHLPIPEGRGAVFNRAVRAAQRHPSLATVLPTFTLLEFGQSNAVST